MQDKSRQRLCAHGARHSPNGQVGLCKRGRSSDVNCSQWVPKWLQKTTWELGDALGHLIPAQYAKELQGVIVRFGVKTFLLHCSIH